MNRLIRVFYMPYLRHFYDVVLISKLNTLFLFLFFFNRENSKKGESIFNFDHFELFPVLNIDKLCAILDPMLGILTTSIYNVYNIITLFRIWKDHIFVIFIIGNNVRDNTFWKNDVKYFHTKKRKSIKSDKFFHH